ncbi:helix-turn-helix domain-containing protein [Mucilaginibacter ginsenosidivorax]|uniref:Helix-turn-helix transcriptional regulator n=1 Tax=Mucilaginibacter ginsenosidivorax TaxID=862126 RepID=A0A5B8W0A4_9SPHI|nr:helix-turn-helix transcriptional regulator [Mucilaginibacter ginsenosidivorax]QEC77390.1 helix-turn-helix transcriptional regulator [Mucilaginibacter ginsenosidivorax]
MRGQPKSEIDLYVIGEIKRLRTARGISQARLGAMLDLSDAFIGQIESPRHVSKYSLDQLNSLAVIFGCSPRDFLPERPIASK